MMCLVRLFLQMAKTAVPLLILSGPVGVGKTTIGQEVSSLLSADNVAHTFIDLDALTQTFPRPPDDPYGDRLALSNLRQVWANSLAAGSGNLIVARVVETRSAVDRIQDAVPHSSPKVCQLRASRNALGERVRRRELGSARDWHEIRALELYPNLAKDGPCDFVVETEGRLPPNIAREIVAQVTWST